mgnify:CR=1 FL=1
MFRAVSLENLYGYFQPVTEEWKDGVLASAFKVLSHEHKGKSGMTKGEEDGEEEEGNNVGKQSSSRETADKEIGGGFSWLFGSEERQHRWMVFDGPIDPVWVENLNRCKSVVGGKVED